jgi:peptidoglycan/xylan/chitin deacetylase (PgdA/CDA1 family)
MRFRYVCALMAFAGSLAACAPAPAAGGLSPTTPAANASAAVTVTVLPPSLTPAPPTLAPSPTPSLPPPTPTATETPAPTTTPVAWPTPDAETASRHVRLPILMYHYIEPWPAGADEVRQGLTVRPEDFAAQMAYLHERGYATVSLYDLMDALTLGRPLPERAVVLTFDDGYRTLMDYALPALRPYGYTGTVFVITQLMDEDFPQYLTWPQAEALYAEGWKIEPHTKTHELLAGRGRDFQLYQMLGSMQTVEAHIGVTPRFFAYPAGRYDELSIQLAAEMHLWGAVTVAPGRTHTHADRYTLHRVRISGTGTLQDFINALEGDLLLAPPASTRTP